MTKSPAKSAASPRKAVGKVAAAARKPAPKKAPAAAPKKSAVRKPAPSKAAPKPASKGAKNPVSKAASKAAPKAVPKAAPKPVAKAAPKSAPKPVTKSTLKTSSTPVAAKPAAKPPTLIVEKIGSAKAAPPAKPVAKPTPKSGYGRAVQHAVPPEPDAAASRFADRYAPARPARLVAMPEAYKPPTKVDPKLANAWKTKAGREFSEGELLAMPDTEYMNEKQLEFFRVRLTALKDDLLSNAGETTEHLREDTSIVPDPADRATIEEEHALELRTRDRERKLLKKISQSLTRIEAGDYGFCDETGEPIGLARLLARPTATLSLEAQQRREMKQKMFGD